MDHKESHESMKTKTRPAIILISLLFPTLPASASPIPEEYSGVVTKVDARTMTVRGDPGLEIFNIAKAGVCGWPTCKRVSEVFKVGEKVIIYHFCGIDAEPPIKALNVFFSDEAKVKAFQKQEGSSCRPISE